MISTPNRIKQLRDAIESGEQITQTEINRLATLQPLDLVIAGREFVEQAVVEQETNDARIADLLAAEHRRVER